MADGRMWLAGLTAGAAGGLLLSRLREGPPPVRYLGRGRQVLVGMRGPVRATLLAARVQARYDELYARRLRFGHPALRQHYEGTILAGVALYQTLLEDGDDRAAALATLDRILAVAARHSVLGQLVQVMRRLPDAYPALRVMNRWALNSLYPEQGWRFEWVEDSHACIAFDARECFYVNLFAHYGTPELTAHFCALDDLLYGDLPGISWERTQTLGRGDDRCNFRFRRVAAPGAGAVGR